jgi:hypothetical protein
MSLNNTYIIYVSIYIYYIYADIFSENAIFFSRNHNKFWIPVLRSLHGYLNIFDPRPFIAKSATQRFYRQFTHSLPKLTVFFFSVCWRQYLFSLVNLLQPCYQTFQLRFKLCLRKNKFMYYNYHIYLI